MKGESFTAAGKTYESVRQLTAKRLHPEEEIYQDAFGRRVFLISELYPCFDVYDRMYENRYFHYHYIETDAADGSGKVYVEVRTADDQDEIRVSGPYLVD